MSNKHLPDLEQPRDLLKRVWGYDAFRPMQEEAINCVLGGRDALVILPTGGGKSVCYQVPGLVRPGLCLVITPLIALMKDQVEQLRKRGIRADAVFSGLSYHEIDVTLDNAAYGDTRFLYVSPERLETPIFRERVQKMPVNLIAVDEAHCISQWGYDFRPAYMNIPALRELLPGVPLMAVTASATPEVRDDIREKAAMSDPGEFRTSFRRDNLAYVVRKVENKPAKLLEVLSRLSGSGILYVRSRRKTAQLAEFLREKGYAASHYHAGLDPQTRSERQRQWMSGEVPLMVCTNAFGMGIDKSAVRYVIHWEVPDSPEAYYQEAGRAGRDGKPSYAVLLYTPADLGRLRASLTRQYPPLADIRAAYNALCNHLKVAMHSGYMMTYDFDLQKFTRAFRLDMVKTYHILKMLEQEGYMLLSDSVHLPSRLKFLLSSRDIYKFQVEHARWDKLIQALLRTYGGIVDHYTPISETYLADRLKVRADQLKKDLVQLKKLGVVNYIPFRVNPSLTFLRNRVPDTSLVLDREFWKLRERVARDKAAAIEKYCLDEETCKQVLISQYFGETDGGPCGRCSTCVDQKRKAVPPSLREEVLGVLRPSVWIPLDDLVRDKGHLARSEFIETVRELAEEGLVSLEEGKVRLKSSGNP